MKKIRVCHVSSVHDRYDNRIFIKMCESLSKHNYEVFFVVNDNKENEKIDNIQILSTTQRSKSKVKRIVYDTRIVRKLAESTKADIFHFHDPELLFVAKKIKAKLKCHIIFDFHEDVPEQIKYKSSRINLFRSIISKIYSIIEKKIIKNFDSIITVSPNILRRLEKINANTYVITNYPKLTPRLEKTDTNPKYIVYAGTIGGHWNHENILLAIKDIPNLEYHIAGRISNAYLQKLKSISNGKLKYLGYLDRENTRNLLANALVGMALLNYETQVGVEGTLGNNKFFEYMEASIPILSSDNRIWKNIIEKDNCGICVNPNNVDQIAKNLIFLMSNTDMAKSLGNNGRIAVENKYNWDIEEEKLLAIYSRINCL